MRVTAPLLAIALVTVGLAGCVTPSEDGAPDGSIPFETLRQGQQSGIDDRRTEVVRSQSTFEQLWAEHTEDQTDPEPAPSVTFSERMVLAVFKGQSPDGCHGAQITNVTGNPATVEIVVQGEYVEVTGMACHQAVTQPFHMVTIPRSDADVRFEMEETTRQRGNDSMDLRTLAQGDGSGIEDRRTVVVQNETAWSALWSEHVRDQTDPPARPEVDFEDRTVLAVFKGQSSDGCHGAEVNNATRLENGTLRVDGAFYHVVGQGCTLQVTYPYHMVSIPRHDGTVWFSIDEETRQAGDDDETSEPEPGPGDQGTYTCRAPGQAGASAPEDGATVAFETIEQGAQSGIEEPCLTVARTETAWRDLWTAHQSRTTDPDPRPEINFTERMVVAIFKGESPDGCHRAEIGNLTMNGSALVVEGVYAEITGMACHQAVTQPFHLVETDRHDTVRFDVQNETRQA